MDLSIVVDRGDIWYDLPFDEKGNFHYPPRKKYPNLTLYVRTGGKLTALARWRTTIGSWRNSCGIGWPRSARAGSSCSSSRRSGADRRSG